MIKSRAAAVAAGALALVMALSGCQTTIQGVANPGAEEGRRPVPFAPYVDISVPRPDLGQVAQATGSKHVVLAFALAGAGGSCEPSWGGQLPVDDPKLKAEVDALRKAGGDVTVATGGATGGYLENACKTSEELAGAYMKLLDTMGTNRLDVDIEQPAPADVIVDALSRVQRERNTQITLTLAIALGGLNEQGLDLVKRAAAARVDVTVNGMDMNFKTGGNWGQAMVDAAQATLDQLRQVYPDASEIVQNRTLGLTIMIGRNDVGVITTQADAQKVLEFAQSRKIGSMGIWSLARDNGKCPKKVKASYDCSGVAQQDFEFTKMLNAFSSPS
jgi:chitinase